MFIPYTYTQIFKAIKTFLDFTCSLPRGHTWLRISCITLRDIWSRIPHLIYQKCPQIYHNPLLCLSRMLAPTRWTTTSKTTLANAASKVKTFHHCLQSVKCRHYMCILLSNWRKPNSYFLPIKFWWKFCRWHGECKIYVPWKFVHIRYKYKANSVQILVLSLYLTVQ